MTERPILFSGPMVQAILAGRKTMTRRVVKPQPYIVDHRSFTAWRWDHGPGEVYTTWKTDLDPLTFVGMACVRRPCPYGKVGDRLWVRETWARTTDYDGNHLLDGVKALYQADNDGVTPTRWRPSIHMPRWASRITLEITGVRVERLQGISEGDAIAEGAGTVVPGQLTACSLHPAVYAFRLLWESINGKRGFGWDANPWVWVISFKRVEVTP